MCRFSIHVRLVVNMYVSVPWCRLVFMCRLVFIVG